MLKKLILLILVLQSIAFGRFSQSSAFVVEDRNLYCYIEDTKSIKEYKEGEIISANFAINYCSYNIETVENLKHKYQSEGSTKQQRKDSLMFFAIIFGLATLIYLLYFVAKNHDN